MITNISVLSIPIAVITQKTAIPAVKNLLAQKKQVFIATPNPEHIMLAQKDKEFAQTLNNTDLNIPDGIGVVWAAGRILKSQNSKIKTIERVAGVDLMFDLCKYAATLQPPNTSYRIGLLGGAKGVAKKAVENLNKQIPGLDIIDLPYYEYGQKDKEIVQIVNDDKINILFVALGAPKQELFISKYLKSMSTVRLAMGVGGAFDIYAGKLQRPAFWIRKSNLEWLFRLFQEPWRWKRQWNLISFCWQVLNTKY